MPRLKTSELLCSLLMIVLFAGCEETANLTGKVTGGGSVVDGGNIIFKPVESGIKPAAGQIQADGTFVLKTAGNNALVPGSYNVLFTAPLPLENGDAESSPPSQWRSWQAPDEPVVVEPGDNNVAIELIEKSK